MTTGTTERLRGESTGVPWGAAWVDEVEGQTCLIVDTDHPGVNEEAERLIDALERLGLQVCYEDVFFAFLETDMNYACYPLALGELT